ncbi:MAG: hypothetical protein P1U41_05040 [Vicingaceae bacterium]|nr:hypothetical protein [Vicingaceae bacterium]
MSKLKILHIINPFNGSDEHTQIQSLTLQSILAAKNYSSNIEITNCAVVFEEDKSSVPNFIEQTELIDRSVLDVNKNLKNRKLPILGDVLEKGSKLINTDYIIYTNIDIGLQPNFYESVAEFTAKGYDAFAINRRRVSEKYTNVNQLNQIYAEVGEMHIGYDCFVFKTELLKCFKLNNVCVGIPFVDSAILFNLIAYSNSFKLFTNKHLTFHVGYDLVKNWGSKAFIHHNKREYQKILNEIKGDIKLNNIPGSGYSFFKRHYKWLMNPTMPYPLLFSLDFKGGDRYHQDKKLKGYYERLQPKISLD